MRAPAALCCCFFKCLTVDVWLMKLIYAVFCAVSLCVPIPSTSACLTMFPCSHCFSLTLRLLCCLTMFPILCISLIAVLIAVDHGSGGKITYEKLQQQVAGKLIYPFSSEATIASLDPEVHGVERSFQCNICLPFSTGWHSLSFCSRISYIPSSLACPPP